MISDVLTAGPGPPGCRQTTTMAEENVSYCTNIRSLNTGPRHLRFQDRTPERPEVSVPRSVPPAPRIVISQRRNNSKLICEQMDRMSPLAKIVTSPISPPKGTSTSIMEAVNECQASRGMTNQRTSQRSTISQSPARKRVRYSQVASDSAIIRIKRDSVSPLCKSTTSIPQGDRLRLDNRCPETWFWPTVFHDSTNSPVYTVSRDCPWPRANAFNRPPATSFDSIIPLTSWCQPETNTRIPISWYRAARPVHFHQRRSPHRHHRHQRTTVSFHRRLCHPAQARNMPRPRVWLVILLLIGFCPQVLQAPDMAAARHQLHRCQLKNDSLRRNDYWPINNRRVPCTSPRISNDTLEPVIACCPDRRRCLEVYKPVYKGTGLVYIPRARIRPDRDTAPFRRTDYFHRHLYMPQCQRGSPASRPIGISASRLYTNDTIDRKRQQPFTTIVTRRYRPAPKDSSPIHLIPRPLISVTRRRRGHCRCRLAATNRDVCIPIEASKRSVRSIQTGPADPPRPPTSTDTPHSRRLETPSPDMSAPTIVSTISRYSAAVSREQTIDSVYQTIVISPVRHQDTMEDWLTAMRPGTSSRDHRRNVCSPGHPLRPLLRPTRSPGITPPTRTRQPPSPPLPMIVSPPSLPLLKQPIPICGQQQELEQPVAQGVPDIRVRQKAASTNIFRCQSLCRATGTIAIPIQAISSTGSARIVTTDSPILSAPRIASHLRPVLLIAFILPLIDTLLYAPRTSIYPCRNPRIDTPVA